MLREWLRAADPRLDSDEIDPRFSYANERTFLAWNRTALALIGVGLAVANLLPPFDFAWGRRMIALPLIALGGVVSVVSLLEWVGNERAMPGRAPTRVAPTATADDGDRTGRGRRCDRQCAGGDGLMVTDRGLAADRTTLAWRRSGISVIAVGLAVLRGVPTVEGVPPRPWLGILIVAMGASCFALSSVQARARGRHAGTSRPAAAFADLLPVTIATLFTALGAAAIVIVLG